MEKCLFGDPFFTIWKFLTLKEIFNLRCTCTTLCEKIEKEYIDMIIIEKINKRLEKDLAIPLASFKQMMEKYEVVITGPYIAQCIHDEYWDDEYNSIFLIPLKTDFEKTSADIIKELESYFITKYTDNVRPIFYNNHTNRYRFKSGYTNNLFYRAPKKPDIEIYRHDVPRTQHDMDLKYLQYDNPVNINSLNYNTIEIAKDDEYSEDEYVQVYDSYYEEEITSAKKYEFVFDQFKLDILKSIYGKKGESEFVKFTDLYGIINKKITCQLVTGKNSKNLIAILGKQSQYEKLGFEVNLVPKTFAQTIGFIITDFDPSRIPILVYKNDDGDKGGTKMWRSPMINPLGKIGELTLKKYIAEVLEDPDKNTKYGCHKMVKKPNKNSMSLGFAIELRSGKIKKLPTSCLIKDIYGDKVEHYHIADDNQDMIVVVYQNNEIFEDLV